jgi:uncharacterized protein
MDFGAKLIGHSRMVTRSLGHRKHKQFNHPNIMKTRKTYSAKVNMAASLMFFALIITACGSKTEGSATDSAGITTSNSNPPEIDLHTAVLTDNLEAVKQHVAAGSNLNEKDPYGGSSPLITASLFGKPDAAKILIEAGADVNFQNNDGSTALHTAAFFCRPEIVRMLLENGADKALKNKFDATAYESVAAPYSDAKNTYDMMGKILGPMGLKLDYAYIEKMRPEIAAMLK